MSMSYSSSSRRTNKKLMFFMTLKSYSSKWPTMLETKAMSSLSFSSENHSATKNHCMNHKKEFNEYHASSMFSGKPSSCLLFSFAYHLRKHESMWCSPSTALKLKGWKEKVRENWSTLWLGMGLHF